MGTVSDPEKRPSGEGVLGKLATILGVPSHRRIAGGIAAVYLALFLVALQDITLGGRGFGFATTEWARMFERTGAVTFEAVARLTVPGLTVLLSPLNVAIGLVISALVGLNLLVTYIAFRQPRACAFNRTTGIFASLPALLAGGACCAPAVVLILGLQMSAALVTAFQAVIPIAVLLLLVTLKLIVDRTNAEMVAG